MSNNNRHEEIVIVPPTLVETQALPLITDTQYLENFTSESLNRAFLGIVSKGIFRGFNVELSGGLGVIIKRDADLGLSIARYERDGYQISVRQQHDINVTFSAGKTSYAVIEAQYKFGVITSQVDVRSGIDAATVRVIDESSLASHHIVICKATVPDGATELDVAHITYIERLEGGFDLTGHQNHPDPHPKYVKKESISNSIISDSEDKVASSLSVKVASQSLGQIKSNGLIAFSPKVISKSEVIPDNVNATIIGPKITIARGVSITVGQNSILTI